MLRRAQALLPLSLVLHWLQNFGHFMPSATLPPALAVFHSAAHLRWRSRAAICPTDGSFFSPFAALLLRERRAGVAGSDWACDAPGEALVAGALVWAETEVARTNVTSAAAAPMIRMVMRSP